MNYCGSDYVLAKSKRQKSNERTKDPEEDSIVAGAGHTCCGLSRSKGNWRREGGDARFREASFVKE